MLSLPPCHVERKRRNSSMDSPMRALPHFSSWLSCSVLTSLRAKESRRLAFILQNSSRQRRKLDGVRDKVQPWSRPDPGHARWGGQHNFPQRIAPQKVQVFSCSKQGNNIGKSPKKRSSFHTSVLGRMKKSRTFPHYSSGHSYGDQEQSHVKVPKSASKVDLPMCLKVTNLENYKFLIIFESKDPAKLILED